MAWIFIQEITELNELFHKQLCIISQKGAFTKESFLERLEKNAKSFESYTWIYAYAWEMLLYVYKGTGNSTIKSKIYVLHEEEQASRIDKKYRQIKRNIWINEPRVKDFKQ